MDSKKANAALIPHLDSAFNLARWLTRNDQDARDVLQEAFIRALRFFGSLEGEDPKPWFLKIVRNTCYTWIKQNRDGATTEPFDETTHAGDETAPDPEFLLLLNADIARVRNALEQLAIEHCEILILRELEGLTYAEISQVLGVPIGTVMSRIARARAKMKTILENDGRSEK